jgi:hypothetical protein
MSFSVIGGADELMVLRSGSSASDRVAAATASGAGSAGFGSAAGGSTLDSIWKVNQPASAEASSASGGCE